MDHHNAIVVVPAATDVDEKCGSTFSQNCKPSSNTNNESFPFFQRVTHSNLANNNFDELREMKMVEQCTNYSAAQSHFNCICFDRLTGILFNGNSTRQVRYKGGIGNDYNDYPSTWYSNFRDGNNE